MGVFSFVKRLFGGGRPAASASFRPTHRYTARLVTGREAEKLKKQIASGELEQISLDDLKRDLPPGAYLDYGNSDFRGLLDPNEVRRMRRGGKS